MKNIKNLFLSAILALSAASCTLTGTLDMPDDEEPVDGLYLLEKVYENDVLYQQFEYNGKNQITKITVFVNTSPLDFVLRYNSSGDVSSIEELVDFRRNGNTITADYSNGYLSGNTNEILLNSAGLPTTVTYSDGTIDTYTYNAGKLASRNYLGYSFNYSYDTKKAPLYSCETPSWFLIYWIDMWIEMNIFLKMGGAVNLMSSMSISTEMMYANNVTQIGTLYYTCTYNSAGYLKTRETEGLTLRYEYLVK